MKKLALVLLMSALVILFGNVFFLSPVTVNAAGSQQGSDAITYDITSYFDDENTVPDLDNASTYGTKLAVDSQLTPGSNYAFAFWIVNGVVRTDLPVNYQFSLIADMDLKAVFHPLGTGGTTLKYAVAFMDANGDLLKLQYVLPNGAATAPAIDTLSKPGYVVNSGSPWSVPFATVTGNMATILQYTASTTTVFDVAVVNGIADDTTVVYNNVVTVTANAAPSGQYFDHWEVEDRTVSHQSPYSFSVLEATTITAVYSGSVHSDLPMITASNKLAIRSGYDSYLCQFYLPSGYTLVEYGMVTLTSATSNLDLATAGGTRNKGTRYFEETNEFVMSFSTTGPVVSYHAYLVVKTSGDVLQTYYDIPAYQVLNPGFETDSLYGWNASGIWKGEAGMLAYQDATIVNDTYFGSNPYGRDGNYNLGIVWTDASWDQSSERMGNLRSSNFTLGGSGWISFKLGGGQYPSFAYMSVRKTSDNTEVARFGNRHFNNTTIASTQYGSSISNAEAFLFQYYFNLSAVGTLGESYYIVLTDMSSFNWCILSADSFITYYATAPTTTADTLATNIVPTINGVASASNAIINGNFDSNLDGWTNVDGVFSRDSGGFAISNVGGNEAIGILRSSAFTVVGNQYIRFDWAGSLRQDKQIFISIKEVGTNIEVLRYVRRDNLSSKRDGNFDNHMLDLSSLDTSKKYYLEFGDNTQIYVDNRDWCVTKFDSVRFITKTEYDSVTSGDRAVSVTSMDKTFVYVKP